MDIVSFLAGVAASLVGVIATVAVTSKIESIKLKIDSQRNKKMLYAELKDLVEESSERLDLVYKLYAQVVTCELKHDSKWLSEYVIPNELNLVVLKSTLDKCYLELTKPQRKGLRSLIAIVEGIERDILKLQAKSHEQHLSINKKDVHVLLSGFGVIYQLSLALSNEQERYVHITKPSDELLFNTLAAKGLSLSGNDLGKYLNAA
ncbi:hypothetical protein ACS8UU_001245 [Vibrio parahaemolyticus]|nr:hypothetical protein [Vibrio parahaemolyticus]EGR0908879.1 hypothetical protein [Vibrio parahaemolyticus]EGV3808130.1 hypothetical protein [Vibrio parahaemolyticus]EIR4240947.1 hypothetical protein [Vibrio parahaemolyticus]